jgi:hypothetical protein
VETEQERMSLASSRKEDALLGPRTAKIVNKSRPPIFASACLPLDFIVVDNEFLLENFDSVQAARLLLLGQHNLAEITLSEHCQEVEVVKADFSFSLS